MMKNQQIYENIKKYAAELSEAGYIDSGYIAVSADEGLYITTPDAEFADLKEEQVAFVTEKGIEEIDGNFRAAAVLLLCALKSKKKASAAAIVDSSSILAFSKRRKTLPPVLDDMSQVVGVSVRAARSRTPRSKWSRRSPGSATPASSRTPARWSPEGRSPRCTPRRWCSTRR